MPRTFDTIKKHYGLIEKGSVISKALHIPRVILLSGRKRSAKDISAQALIYDLCYTRVALADDLKDLVSTAFNIPRAAMDDERKTQPITNLGEQTPRTLLQAIGTGVRNTLDDRFWIKRVLAKIETGGPYVITDARFLNEIDAFHAIGAMVIRVNRADQPVHAFHRNSTEDRCYFGISMADGACGLPEASHPCAFPEDRHPSETELPFTGAIYDAVVTSPSAEETARRVVELVEKIGEKV